MSASRHFDENWTLNFGEHFNHENMKKFILSILVALAALSSHAQQSAIYSTKDGAIAGYDVVSYYTEGHAVKGKKEIAYRYADADWHFASEENLKAFKDNPEKYLPQYGGYCAFGCSRGYKAPTEPDAFTVVNGKLYLNYNKDVRTEWNKDRDALIKKADANWATVKTRKS